MSSPAPTGSSGSGHGGSSANSGHGGSRATAATSGVAAAGASGAGEQLTAVQAAVARHVDAMSEERRVEELLRSRGAAYEQQHRANSAWPDFSAIASRKSPPRMKQFHEPQEIFVPDEAELPPDMMPKGALGAAGQAIAQRQPPPGLAETARSVSVDLDELASMGLEHIAGGAGVPPDPLALQKEGQAAFTPPPRPYTTAQKLGMVAAAAFFMYGTFTKLRPLWGRQGGAAAQALLGPRASGPGPIFSAGPPPPPRFQKLQGPAWEHLSGVVGGTRPTALSAEGYPLAQGSAVSAPADAGAGTGGGPDPFAGAGGGAGMTAEMEALEKRMAELRARVRAARQARGRPPSAEVRAMAKAAGDDMSGGADVDTSAAGVLGGLVRDPEPPASKS